MTVWCIYRESEEPFEFQFRCETPPPMLAFTQVVSGTQRLREFELVRGDAGAAIYVETPESAKRLGLAA